MIEEVRGPWEDRVRVVSKPWGGEEWFAYGNGRYAGKILTIHAGERLSLQYHRIKHETLLVIEGKVRFSLQNAAGQMEDRDLDPGAVVVVRPGTRHRMEALEHARLVEFSSPELDDVVRVEDDYSSAQRGEPTP